MAKENPVFEPVFITLEEYLKQVDAPATLKGMFAHYTRERGEKQTTKEAFQDLFDTFKSLPADQL